MLLDRYTSVGINLDGSFRLDFFQLLDDLKTIRISPMRDAAKWSAAYPVAYRCEVGYVLIVCRGIMDDFGNLVEVGLPL